MVRAAPILVRRCERRSWPVTRVMEGGRKESEQDRVESECGWRTQGTGRRMSECVCNGKDPKKERKRKWSAMDAKEDEQQGPRVKVWDKRAKVMGSRATSRARILPQASRGAALWCLLGARLLDTLDRFEPRLVNPQCCRTNQVGPMSPLGACWHRLGEHLQLIMEGRPLLSVVCLPAGSARQKTVLD